MEQFDLQRIDDEEGVDQSQQLWVSITGLTLKRTLHVPRFWFHATRCMRVARNSRGNLMAEARTIGDVHHTLSIWQDRRSMLSFLRSDAHRKAIKAFPRIATGKTYGYSATARPDWAEARRLWEVNGREYN